MDLTQLANLGEFIGGLAVLVTLIYLAVQVRHNTKEMRVSSQLEVFNQQDRYTEMILDNPEARRAWQVATGDPLVPPLRNPENLNPAELSIFSTVMFRALNHLQMQWSIWRGGNLSEESWGYAVDILRAYLRTPAAIDWWVNAGRGVFQDAFVAMVDRLIVESAEHSAS